MILHKEIELDTIAKASLVILEETSSDMIDKLFQLGGSSSGARPKIFVDYNPTFEFAPQISQNHANRTNTNGFKN